MNRRAMVGAVTVVAIAITVTALFLLLRAPEPVPARLAHYAVSANDRELTVTIALIQIETIVSSAIEESPGAVKVMIFVSRHQADVPANITFVDRTFTLSAGLGARRVVDVNDNEVAPYRP